MAGPTRPSPMIVFTTLIFVYTNEDVTGCTFTNDKLVQAVLNVLVPLYNRGKSCGDRAHLGEAACQYLLAGPGRKHHHDMSGIDKERPLDV